MVEHLHAEDAKRHFAKLRQSVLLVRLLCGQLTPARLDRVLEDLHQFAVCNGKDVVEEIPLPVSFLVHDRRRQKADALPIQHFSQVGERVRPLSLSLRLGLPKPVPIPNNNLGPSAAVREEAERRLNSGPRCLHTHAAVFWNPSPNGVIEDRQGN